MSEADPRVDPPSEDEVPGLLAEGANLYNAGRYWHAHEAWEGAWHALRAAGRPADADYVQGLILASAAFENLRRGKHRGYRTQVRKAVDRIGRHAGTGRRLGLVDEAGVLETLVTIRDAPLEGAFDVEDLPVDPPRIEFGNERTGP